VSAEQNPHLTVVPQPRAKALTQRDIQLRGRTVTVRPLNSTAGEQRKLYEILVDLLKEDVGDGA
jgi:hypothetical protein